MLAFLDPECGSYPDPECGSYPDPECGSDPDPECGSYPDLDPQHCEGYRCGTYMNLFVILRTGINAYWLVKGTGT